MSTTTAREVTALGGFMAIPAGDVHPSPANPRDRLHDIDDLARSIRERGLIQPIIVQKLEREHGYQIVAGHRRYAACRRLGYSTIPCIVRRPMAADQELLAMLVENGQRAGLDPIEEARAYQKLMDDGDLTIAAVAQQVGRPASHVSNRLMLLDLPAAEQEELRAGHFTITYATGIIRAAREAQRQKSNPVARPVGRPKGVTTKPYFGDTHPLAAAVRARCDHRGSPKVNKVGCGACWEAVIRLDQDAAS